MIVYYVSINSLDSWKERERKHQSSRSILTNRHQQRRLMRWRGFILRASFILLHSRILKANFTLLTVFCLCSFRIVLMMVLTLWVLYVNHWIDKWIRHKINIIFLAALELCNGRRIKRQWFLWELLIILLTPAPQSWDKNYVLHPVTYLWTSVQPDSAITYVCSVRYLCAH